jgi:hypothetical protein
MSSLTTRVGSYKTLHIVADLANTPDTDLAAATGYFVGVPAGAVDLKDDVGAGKDTYANIVDIIVNATDGLDGDTITQELYGVAGQGPPQKIAQVVWKLGLAQVDATATNLWAETATVTSSHATDITVSGADGSDGVGSIAFDATGYRYIYGLFTADSGDPTTVTALYRYF